MKSAAFVFTAAVQMNAKTFTLMTFELNSGKKKSEITCMDIYTHFIKLVCGCVILQSSDLCGGCAGL